MWVERPANNNTNYWILQIKPKPADSSIEFGNLQPQTSSVDSESEEFVIEENPPFYYRVDPSTWPPFLNSDQFNLINEGPT